MRDYEKENVGVKTVKDGEIFFTADAYARYGNYGNIYKNYAAFYEPDKYPEDEIVYIPEFGFPDYSRENVHKDMVVGVTRKDLIELTGGEQLATNLFERLSWSFPTTLWDEDYEDSDKEGHWIEGYLAYEKVYLPEFADGIDRTNQEPVCLNEFLDVEWKNEEYRRYCMNKLMKQGVINADTVKSVMKDFQKERDVLMEEVNYRQAVRERVVAEFMAFEEDEIKKSTKNVFDDSYIINFYKEIKNYLCYGENDYEGLEDIHYKALKSNRGNIISLLYNYYMKSENARVNTWEDIHDMISAYNEKYHKKILQGEIEIE